MTLRYKPILFLFLLSAGLPAQSTIDQVLASIQANNKTILAEKQRMEAEKAFFQTGLTIPDPSITLDWMRGFPKTAGNQTDLMLAQGFDFPTAYKYRKQASSLKTAQLLFESEQVRKDILLEAKMLALHLVYLNKRKTELESRLASAERFLENSQNKLDLQDATILDLNKARLLFANVKTDLQLLEAERTEYLEKLTSLNGGNQVVFSDTLYPEEVEELRFEDLALARQEGDPLLRYLEMQSRIGETEMQLAKALLLPKFEAGYRYQGLLGQQFHGIHAGVQIPLWENKRQLNLSALQIQVNNARVEDRRTILFHETRRLFDQYQSFQQAFDEYRNILQLSTEGTLLEKALQAGQLTVLEYFLETTLYYESVDRQLEFEEACELARAELMKYRL